MIQMHGEWTAQWIKIDIKIIKIFKKITLSKT